MVKSRGAPVQMRDSPLGRPNPRVRSKVRRTDFRAPNVGLSVRGTGTLESAESVLHRPTRPSEFGGGTRKVALGALFDPRIPKRRDWTTPWTPTCWARHRRQAGCDSLYDEVMNTGRGSI